MIALRKNKNNNPRILFMCSPSLGALDSWLSVLRILKIYHQMSTLFFSQVKKTL